jgi:hypothetical protein
MKIPVKANATRPRRIDLFVASSVRQNSRDARLLSPRPFVYVGESRCWLL